MAAYFVCLFKLAFYIDNSFLFALLFLENILPGTVKSVPAKLCVAFLCTLLNRLRFSPQNVEFGTKSALSGAPAPALPKGEPRSKARC